MPRKSNKPSAEQAVRDIRWATRRGLLNAAVRSPGGGGGHFNTVNRTLVTATNGHSGNTKKEHKLILSRWVEHDFLCPV